MSDGNTSDVDNFRGGGCRGGDGRITMNESSYGTVDRSLFGFTFRPDNALVSIFWQESGKTQRYMSIEKRLRR